MPGKPETPFNVNASLTRDFLAWLEQSPRTYGEVMEIWRTSCPRLAIWEDALADGVVAVESTAGSPMNRAVVRVTARGRAALDGSSLERPSPEDH